MVIEVVDGNVVGYKTIQEKSAEWGYRYGTLSALVQRGRVKTLRIGNMHFIKDDEPKPKNLKYPKCDGYITPRELAKKWGVSYETVMVSIREKRVDYIMIGNRYLIKADTPKPPDRRRKNYEDPVEKRSGYLGMGKQ